MGRDKVNGTLPVGSTRIMQLVEKSRAKQERPKLPDEYEALLQPVHAKSAACYASMEDLSDRIERLSQKIAADDGVVLDDMDDGDSVVNHIDDVTMEIRQSHTRLAAAAATPPMGIPVSKETAKKESNNDLPSPVPERASTR